MRPEIVQQFKIDKDCYYKIEHYAGEGFKAIIRAGIMHVTNMYDLNQNQEDIINHAVQELKLRAKVSKDLTLYNIKKLLNLIENRNQLKLF